jgi:hypothetical protein
VRFIAASLSQTGRMSCSQAAAAVRTQARHRAQVARFLARDRWAKDWAVLVACADLLLAQEAQRGGTWLFLLDQTHVGQQGRKTENTFSRGNYRPRPKNSSLRKQKKHARRSCHCFVCGLLITPSGIRIPGCRCYYTKDFCQAKKKPYKTQVALAAELIREVVVPPTAAVVVLGDTAFEAKGIRIACNERGFGWIVPLNPERVLAGAKPRAKVRSLSENLSSFCRAVPGRATQLIPGQGAYAAQQRPASCRLGPKANARARTFWVHPERREVHNVGDVLLVFSTNQQPPTATATNGSKNKVLVQNRRC